MCPRGTFGHCDDAYNWQRNFFWAGLHAGDSIRLNVTAEDLLALHGAFVEEQPIAESHAPQKLYITENYIAEASRRRPSLGSRLRSGYNVISVDGIEIKERKELVLLAAKYRLTAVDLLIADSGLRIYETCGCTACPAGTYQEGLGRTNCQKCEDSIPGSHTEMPGATGLEMCKCLPQLDVYEKAPGEPCAACGGVRDGTASGPRGSCPCSVGYYETPVDPSTNESWVTCAACPANSDTRTLEGDPLPGTSSSACVCKMGYTTASSGECVSCSVFQTTDAGTGTCVVSSSAALGIGLSSAAFILLIVVGAVATVRFRRRIAQLEQEREMQIAEKVREARGTVGTLAHPMVLVTAEVFQTLGCMTSYEECRGRGLLCVIDTVKQLEELRTHKTIVFFSHQWLAWGHPDPENHQYDAMSKALDTLVSDPDNKADMKNTMVWVDYSSIPQVHSGMQKLAINSLPMYAGACDFFVIVAPGQRPHQDTGESCDEKSYLRRVWCRAEQLAHGCRVGVETMYITTDEGLVALTWEWLRQSFVVFSGDLTCCARGHEGGTACDRELLVSPILGLYADLLERQKRGPLPAHLTEVIKFMQENEEVMFPKHYVFKEKGQEKGEKRELFGNMIEYLMKHADTGSTDTEGTDEVSASVDQSDVQVATERTSDVWKDNESV